MWLHDPADAQTLLSLDGPAPILPGFDTFIEIRKLEEQKEFFGETLGLISQVGAGGGVAGARARSGASSGKLCSRT